ncbi:MAG: O-antigen ligase family protein [Chloroflexi bacterium]|nr:O-antigen ligase family protein [Chloroflexota bacterium]
MPVSPWRQALQRVDAQLQEDALSLALKWAVRLGVVLLFFTPLIVTPSGIFPFVVGKAVWSRSLIEIVAGLYVLLAIRSPEFRPTRSPLVLLLGLHLLAVFVAGVFGSSFNLSFWSSYERMGGIFDLAHWTVLAAVLVFTVKSLREWKVLASISLVFGLAAGFLGLADKYDYEIVNYLQGNPRISGAAGNPSFLAGHMMVNALIALALLGDSLVSLSRRRNPVQVGLAAFYGLSIVISLWVLNETETRGSAAGLLTGVVAAAAIYAVFSGRPRLRLAAIAIGVAMPIAVIALFIARDTAFVEDLAERNTFISRVRSISLDEGSVRQRATGLRIAGQAFAARPLTGWGGENFEVPYQRYQREGEVAFGTPVLDRAHNKPMDLLATSGLIGFATYMAVWGWLGFLAWRRVRGEPGDRVFNAGVAGALIALFIHNLFLFDTAVTLLMFALFAAWAAAGERRSTAAEPSSERSARLPERVLRPLRWAAPALVGLIVIVGVYGINLRIYRAAQLFIATGADVQEVSANLGHFSPLATFGRERLLKVMTGRWDDMDTFDRIRLVPQLEAEARLALDAEPDNMELRFAVAGFYRIAARDLPELMEQARLHTDRGAELGPNTVVAARELAAQSKAERELSERTSQG